MAIIVGRPINGIGLNGLEYLLGANDEVIKFEDEAQAKAFLEEHGYLSDDDFYVFEEHEEAN